MRFTNHGSLLESTEEHLKTPKSPRYPFARNMTIQYITPIAILLLLPPYSLQDHSSSMKLLIYSSITQLKNNRRVQCVSFVYPGRWVSNRNVKIGANFASPKFHYWHNLMCSHIIYKNDIEASHAIHSERGGRDPILVHNYTGRR